MRLPRCYFAMPKGKFNKILAVNCHSPRPARPDQTQVNRGDYHGAPDAAPTGAATQPLFGYGYGLTYQQAQPDWLNSALPEQGSAAGQLTELVLFERDLKAPWFFVLQSGEQSAQVSSNQQQLGTARLQSFDRQVQEDARLFSNEGNSRAALALRTSFPRDLRAFNQAGAVLKRWQLKLDAPATAAVTVAMRCNEQCAGEVVYQQHLRATDAGPMARRANRPKLFHPARVGIGASGSAAGNQQPGRAATQLL